MATLELGVAKGPGQAPAGPGRGTELARERQRSTFVRPSSPRVSPWSDRLLPDLTGVSFTTITSIHFFETGLKESRALESTPHPHVPAQIFYNVTSVTQASPNLSFHICELGYNSVYWVQLKRIHNTGLGVWSHIRVPGF